MNNQYIDKTGLLVKVHMNLGTCCNFRYGITLRIKNDLFIIFKDGSCIKVANKPKNEIEYVCATYLVCEKIDFLEDIFTLFEAGIFDSALKCT